MYENENEAKFDPRAGQVVGAQRMAQAANRVGGTTSGPIGPAPPGQEGGLLQKLDYNGSMLHEVHDLLTRLEKRLDPVLLPAPPATDAKNGVERSYGLVGVAEGQEQQIRALAQRLDYLISRLTL